MAVDGFVLVLLVSPLFVGWLVTTRVSVQSLYRWQMLANLIVSLLGAVLCYQLMPVFKRYLIRARLCGKDLNKPGIKENKPDVPESLGVVVGTVYVVLLTLCQLLYVSFANDNGADTHTMMLVEYNAALHCITFMIFLGFADDVLDLPWRYKLILPTIATLPLLVAYDGGTFVIVPIPLRFVLGGVVDLGVLYKVYMGLLSVFCTNCINIYAGVNGLEVGQSFIIGCAVIMHNLVEVSGALPAYHTFSIFLMVPFVCVSGALLVHNFYPSHVFVGDCYTYFAGMSLTVVGVLGHFSKTLMLFFIPQILNFIISLPQLLRIIPCPRHRLPRFNATTGLLEAVPEHWTLINVVLRVVGPLHERTLVIILLIFQVMCCALAFFVRYYVSTYFY